MDLDPGLLVLTHCDPERRLFCLQPPELCPLCRRPITSSPVLPVRVPYPFVRASQHPTSVFVRPTTGDFLTEYVPGDELHMGVTDSRGSVVEFGRRGLERGGSELWDRALKVYSHPTPWDDRLYALAALPDTWTERRYHEEKFNCFSFCVALMRSLGRNLGGVEFCRLNVVPPLASATKYSALYRRVREVGYYVTGPRA